MKKKRDYAVIQLGFKTEKEYAKFCKEAEKAYGTGRRAKSLYLRDCIEANRKNRKRTSREKVIGLVESTQKLNDILLSTDDPYVYARTAEALREQVALWGN